MNDIGLLMTCVASFIAVFALLVFLAGCIRALTLIFPAPEPVEPERWPDAAVTAAIVSAASATYPGLRVTRIVEER